MAEQVLKSEQINSCMQMVIDYDQPLIKQEDFLIAYKKALGGSVSIFKYQRTKKYMSMKKMVILIILFLHQ